MLDSKFPRLIVTGYARHGKDTVCEMLCRRYGITFVSSSFFVAEKAVMPALAQAGKTYASVHEAYADRGNHRATWYKAIRDYNRPDAGRLGRELFAEHNIYCGLRSSAEFNSLRNSNAFDLSIWVDSSERLLTEPSSSMTIQPWMADVVIDNNGTLKELEINVEQLCNHRIDQIVDEIRILAELDHYFSKKDHDTSSDAALSRAVTAFDSVTHRSNPL